MLVIIFNLIWNIEKDCTLSLSDSVSDIPQRCNQFARNLIINIQLLVKYLLALWGYIIKNCILFWIYGCPEK